MIIYMKVDFNVSQTGCEPIMFDVVLFLSIFYHRQGKLYSYCCILIVVFLLFVAMSTHLNSWLLGNIQDFSRVGGVWGGAGEKRQLLFMKTSMDEKISAKRKEMLASSILNVSPSALC